jgi:hypothetical protein
MRWLEERAETVGQETSVSYFCYLQSADGTSSHFEALGATSADEAKILASTILNSHDSAVRAEVRSEDDDLIWELHREPA